MAVTTLVQSRRVADQERTRVAKDVEAAGLVADGSAWLEDASEATLEALDARGEATSTQLRDAVPLLQGSTVLRAGQAVRRIGARSPAGADRAIGSGRDPAGVEPWRVERLPPHVGDHLPLARREPGAATGAHRPSGPGAPVALRFEVGRHLATRGAPAGSARWSARRPDRFDRPVLRPVRARRVDVSSMVHRRRRLLRSHQPGSPGPPAAAADLHDPPVDPTRRMSSSTLAWMCSRTSTMIAASSPSSISCTSRRCSRRSRSGSR